MIKLLPVIFFLTNILKILDRSRKDFFLNRKKGIAAVKVQN